jgi:hypothetical protein
MESRHHSRNAFHRLFILLWSLMMQLVDLSVAEAKLFTVLEFGKESKTSLAMSWL